MDEKTVLAKDIGLKTTNWERGTTDEVWAELDRYRKALEFIASHAGKTLISMEHGQPYSIGANAAFEDMAIAAREALDPA